MANNRIMTSVKVAIASGMALMLPMVGAPIAMAESLSDGFSDGVESASLTAGLEEQLQLPAKALLDEKDIADIPMNSVKSLEQGSAADGAPSIVLSVAKGSNPDQAIEDAKREISKTGVEVSDVSVLESTKDTDTPMFTVTLKDDKSKDNTVISKKAGEAAAKAETVKSSAPEKVFRALAVDPLHSYEYQFNGRWSPKNNGIGINEARTLAQNTKRSASIVVIDTGFRTSHVELQGQLNTSLAYNAVTGQTGASAMWDDVRDHGTGICSLLVGKGNNGSGGYGMCANTKVVPMIAGTGDGYFRESFVISAIKQIEKLIDEKKLTNLNAVVMSFGAYYTDAQKAEWDMEIPGKDLLYDAIKELYSKYGVVCVCAGGNGPDGGKSRNVVGHNYPSDYTCCVAVTASDSKGRNCVWSDANDRKDLTAPGEGLVVASSQSNTAYDTQARGTSFSAPIVAGAISTLRQINPSLSQMAAVNLLKKTAVLPPANSYYRYASQNKNNAGIINLAKAAYYAKSIKVQGTTISYPATIPYAAGVQDFASFSGVKYGFQVLSPAKKTARMVSKQDLRDKTVSAFTYPLTAKLGKTRYSITQFQDMTLKKVTFKKKNFTKKNLKNCFKGAKQVKQVVIKLGKSKTKAKEKALKAEYKKLAKKYLTKSYCGAKVVKIKITR